MQRRWESHYLCAGVCMFVCVCVCGGGVPPKEKKKRKKRKRKTRKKERRNRSGRLRVKSRPKIGLSRFENARHLCTRLRTHIPTVIRQGIVTKSQNGCDFIMTKSTAACEKRCQNCAGTSGTWTKVEGEKTNRKTSKKCIWKNAFPAATCFF